MLRRLALMMFALTFAFAGAGRVEAATSHCLKAAAELAQPAPDDAPACHKAAHEAQKAAPDHKPAPPHADVCMCLTLAKAAVWAEPVAASGKAAATSWVRPAAIAFVSIEPSPERPPPRA